MEAQVQTMAADQNAQIESNQAEPQGPEIQNESGRAAEELRMLYMGFALGLSIGGVFLVYVVLSAADLLK